MRNYERIEKLEGHAYYTGYGNNGEVYHIYKRDYGYRATCTNPDVRIMQYSREAKTLRELNDWLGGLEK